jgi:RNA polymerase sigma factor (sigma-70 family)
MTQAGSTTSLGTIQTLWDHGAVAGSSDAQLLEQFLSRTSEIGEIAFAALVERHGPMVRRVCHDVLGNADDAQDAAQASFLVLARKARSIKKPESLACWLYGVALRVARRAKKDAARRRLAERGKAEVMALVSGRQQNADPLPCPELFEEIGRLPEKYQWPIVLCYVQGQTHQQASESLKWPMGTLQARLHRGRHKLRARLTHRGIVAPGLTATGLTLGAPSAFAASLPPGWAAATARAAVACATGAEITGMVSAATARLSRAAATSFLPTSSRIAVLGIYSATVAVLVCAVIAAVHTWGRELAGLFSGRPTEQTIMARPRRFGNRGTTNNQPTSSAVLVREIQGKVTDEMGDPFPGANVQILGGSERFAPVITDQQGRFAIPLPASSLEAMGFRVTLRASTPRGERQALIPIMTAADAQRSRPHTLVLRAASEIDVRVQDQAGQPVPEAWVEALESGGLPITAGLTNAEGILRLRIPLEALVGWFVGLKPGVGFDFVENRSPIPRDYPGIVKKKGPAPEPLRLVLDGARRVSVKVVGSNGAPVAGVELSPSSLALPGRKGNLPLGRSEVANATSQEDGSVTFSWFPSRLRDRVVFRLRSKGFDSDIDATFNPQAENDEIQLQVFRSARISGRVRGPDGKPTVGLYIKAQGYEDGPSMIPAFGRSATDDDGTYVMSLPARRHYVVATHAMALASKSHVGLYLEEGQQLTGVDFTLSRGALIRGTVTGPDGKPAQRETVGLKEIGEPISSRAAISEVAFETSPGNKTESFDRMMLTNADGRYEFRVGPGRFLVLGPRDGLPVGPKDGEKTLIINSEEVVGRDIVINPADTRLPLTGLVTDGRGGPVAGAVISGHTFARPAEASHFRVFSGRSSRFEARRLPEPMLVYARTLDHKQAGVARIGADDQSVDIVLSVSATAQGRVLDKDDKPRADVSVICRWGFEAPGENSIEELRKTDQNGQYLITGLPVGATVSVELAQDGGVVTSHRVRIVKEGFVDLPDLGESAEAKRRP